MGFCGCCIRCYIDSKTIGIHAYKISYYYCYSRVSYIQYICVIISCDKDMIE